MKRKQLLVVLGLVGVAGLATGCKDQKAQDDTKAAQATADATKARVDTIAGYLKEHSTWERMILMPALCRLELVADKDIVRPGDRICPGGPGDTKTPPVYPPAP